MTYFNKLNINSYGTKFNIISPLFTFFLRFLGNLLEKKSRSGPFEVFTGL